VTADPTTSRIDALGPTATSDGSTLGPLGRVLFTAYAVVAGSVIFVLWAIAASVLDVRRRFLHALGRRRPD